MDLDAKQKVLIAIYTEYQKDKPNMQSILRPEILGLDRDTIKIALVKLDNEGMVNDLRFQWGGDGSVPLDVHSNFAKMSRYGIEYVERKLNIDPILTGEEKVKSTMVKCAEWGWEQMKDLGAKIIAEMIKP